MELVKKLRRIRRRWRRWKRSADWQAFGALASGVVGWILLTAAAAAAVPSGRWRAVVVMSSAGLLAMTWPGVAVALSVVWRGVLHYGQKAAEEPPREEDAP